jgi:hypothetical protein
MTIIKRLVYVFAVCALLTACVVSYPEDVAGTQEAALPAPQAYPEPTSMPTAAGPAPERTFTDVGNVGHLEGPHDVAGKAIVAGLQTLIIQGFHFDGKGPAADVRLVQGEDYATPAAILLPLEARVYADEVLLFTIPSTVAPENADRLVIYAPETGEVYAETTFE